MNVYKIAVVEDEKEQSQNLKNILTRYAESRGLRLKVAVYATGEAFLPDAAKFDLAFLDIDLSGNLSKKSSPQPSSVKDGEKGEANSSAKKNGMAIAAKVREAGLSVPIVFVTNLVAYAVEGYSVGALDFIVKPVSYESLSIKMDRIVKKAFQSRKSVTLRVGTTVRSIAVDSIKYVEVRGHKLTVHSVDGDYDAYVPLGAITDEIDGANFIRCNVCYLVNLAFVTGMDGNVVYLGKDVVTVSRSKKKEFVTALNRFLGGNL